MFHQNNPSSQRDRWKGALSTMQNLDTGSYSRDQGPRTWWSTRTDEHRPPQQDSWHEATWGLQHKGEWQELTPMNLNTFASRILTWVNFKKRQKKKKKKNVYIIYILSAWHIYVHIRIYMFMHDIHIIHMYTYMCVHTYKSVSDCN